MPVPPRIHALAAIATVAIAAAVPASAAAQEPVVGDPVPSPMVLSVEPNETPVDGWNGWLVWSRRAADGRYALIARNPEGIGITLPVEPQSTPIDAGIGPGPDGSPLVVYSRCSVPSPRSPRGCDVYKVDPQTGVGGRVPSASRPNVDERYPSVWGNTIAFSLSTSKVTAGVAVARLDGPAPKRPTIFGPRREPAGNRYVTATAYGPRGIDLRKGQIAFSWQSHARGERWRLVSAKQSGKPHTLMTTVTTSKTVSAIGRPALGARDVIVPVLRTGGSGKAEVIRTTLSGSKRWTLRGGFSAAQTERYGAAITAVARTTPNDLVIVRRLASDGRWACVAAAVPNGQPAASGGCELLRYADTGNSWLRVRLIPAAR